MFTLITWLRGVCYCKVSHRFPFLIIKCFVRGYFKFMWTSCSFLNFLFINVLVYIIMVSWFNRLWPLLSLFIWPVGAHSCWFLCSFDILPSFFEHYLAFWWVTHCSEIILYFPCPALKLALSPRRPDAVSWRVVFRNPNLDDRCAHCYQDVAAAPTASQQVNKLLHCCPRPRSWGLPPPW